MQAVTYIFLTKIYYNNANFNNYDGFNICRLAISYNLLYTNSDNVICDVLLTSHRNKIYKANITFTHENKTFTFSSETFLFFTVIFFLCTYVRIRGWFKTDYPRFIK